MSYRKDYKPLGRYLKNARVSQNLTQMDVAERIGLTSPQFISNWERGLCSVSVSTIKKLIRIYKLDKKEVISLLLDIEEKHIRKNL